MSKSGQKKSTPSFWDEYMEMVGHFTRGLTRCRKAGINGPKALLGILDETLADVPEDSEAPRRDVVVVTLMKAAATALEQNGVSERKRAKILMPWAKKALGPKYAELLVQADLLFIGSLFGSMLEKAAENSEEAGHDETKEARPLRSTAGVSKSR